MGDNRFGHRFLYLKLKERVLNLWNYTPWGYQIQTSGYTVRSERIPPAFQGFRIVQISDIHGKEFGKDQGRLFRAIKRLNPDLILITGDIVQEFYEKKQRIAMISLLNHVPSIAPTYMILGNHETRSPYLKEVLSDIENSPVELLRNEGRWLERQGERIYLYGMDTGITSRLSSNRDDEEQIESILTECRGQAQEVASEKLFMILMAHKPENFPVFRRTGMDLVFSGHAHGGFMKLFGKRLIAPGQGFFPTYTHGLYREKNTSMIVSQGLGGPRFGIKPEVVLAVLQSSKSTEN